MSDHIETIALDRTPAAVRRFLRFSYLIYERDPLWVAPLLMDLAKVFSDANPLFEHARMQLWLALRNGREAGRLAAVIDRTHNETQNDRAAFVGFFECENDPAVSRALFEAAAAWARENGIQRLMGPMNPTMNDECGLLVEGFDSSPALMMPYNPPYYAALFEAAGFLKTKDLLAYHLNVKDTPMDRLGRLAERAKKKWPELTLRPIRRRTLEADLVKIKDIYNSAWEKNWGFVPMNGAEVDFLAERLKPLLLVDISWLAEVAGEPAAFLMALPDYNVAFKPLRGRVLTPKLALALPYLLGWKTPRACRVITLGVKAAYRGKGLESLMLFEGLKAGSKAGLETAEASWILEDNTMMTRLMEVYAGRVYKRYRLFERPV